MDGTGTVDDLMKPRRHVTLDDAAGEGEPQADGVFVAAVGALEAEESEEASSILGDTVVLTHDLVTIHRQRLGRPRTRRRRAGAQKSAVIRRFSIQPH